jgi:hypothetical protein
MLHEKMRSEMNFRFRGGVQPFRKDITMALTGTLADMGVIDLLKFPHSTEKSGELIIAGLEEEARMYYDKGQIYHSICGHSTGMDAIIELLFFQEGEFEFRSDVTSSQQTVNTAIDELIPQALALKEQLAAKRKKSSPPMQPRSPGGGDLSESIRDSSSKYSYIKHVALYRRNGSAILNWDKDGPDEAFNNIIDNVIALLDSHPRDGLHKIYMSHAHGTAVASVLNEDIILLLDSDTSSSLGMLSLASARITQTTLENM